jgi:hypothetical protein
LRTYAWAFVAAAVAALVAAPDASAHKADPHYLTVVNAVQPATSGVSVDVLNRSDQLELHNTSGKDVMVEGYDGEPYAQVLGDGTVEVNTQSPAYYLNQDRFAATKPPAGVTAKSAPQWKKLDKTGRFAWHDHRMHWMAKTRPVQVKNPDVKTKVFDWSVPLTIDGSIGKIAGTLFWTPPPGGNVPVGAIIVGAAILIGLFLMVFVVRRRRAAEPVSAGGGEAW